MKYPETESEICAGAVPRSCAICGKAGSYMSIENGLTVLSAPRMRMIRRFERALFGICKCQSSRLMRGGTALPSGVEREHKRTVAYAKHFPS